MIVSYPVSGGCYGSLVCSGKAPPDRSGSAGTKGIDMTTRPARGRKLVLAMAAALIVSLTGIIGAASPTAAQEPESEKTGRLDTGTIIEGRQEDVDTGNGSLPGGEIGGGIVRGPNLVVDDGSSGPGGSIIGGTPANRADHPHYVEVGTLLQGGCGGSLIDAEWVLTAAHCVENLATPAVGFITFRQAASEVILHPLWDGDTSHGHDLALLRIPPGTSSEASVIQVGSPYRSGPYDAGRSAELVGIGRTSPNGGVGQFNEVLLEIRSDGYMEGLWDPWWAPWSNRYRPSLMIGAGSSIKTACGGDSGGPLSGFYGGRQVQIGVTSFGEVGCAKPAVFSELDNANLAWIASEVPSVKSRWSLCIAGGRAGTPVVYYVPGNVGPHRDGSYSWKLTCVANTPPPPRPDPVDPPICDIKPRKCDLD